MLMKPSDGSVGFTQREETETHTHAHTPVRQHHLAQFNVDIEQTCKDVGETFSVFSLTSVVSKYRTSQILPGLLQIS